MESAEADGLNAFWGFVRRLSEPSRRSYWAALDMEQAGRVLEDCGHRHPTRRLATLCALQLGAGACVVRWSRAGLQQYSDAETALWLWPQSLSGDPIGVMMTKAWFGQRVRYSKEAPAMVAASGAPLSLQFHDGSSVGDETEARKNGDIQGS